MRIAHADQGLICQLMFKDSSLTCNYVLEDSHARGESEHQRQVNKSMMPAEQKVSGEFLVTETL